MHSKLGMAACLAIVFCPFVAVAAPAAYPTPPMITTRYQHAAVLLPDGRLLVTGGYSGAGASTAATELYDSTTATWVAGPPMAFTHVNHTGTLLKDGTALFVGGNGSDVAEIFDPVTGSFASTAAPPLFVHSLHTATLLPNGQVLIAGGGDSPAHLAETELYDPGTGLFASTSPLNVGRYAHGAVLLADGDVLVASGEAEWDGGGPTDTTTSEIYNSLNGWTQTSGNLLIAVDRPTMELLPNGSVFFVTDGSGAGAKVDGSSITQLFQSNSWVYSGDTPKASGNGIETGPYLQAGSLTPGGLPLTLGGWGLANIGGQGFNDTLNYVAQYAPDAGIPSGTSVDTKLATLTYQGQGCGPLWATATWLPNGKLMLAGGTSIQGSCVGGFVPVGFLVDLQAPGFVPPANPYTLQARRNGLTLTLLPDGRVLVAGGTATTPSAEILDPATGVAAAGTMAQPRSRHSATLLLDGRVLLVGGVDGSGNPLASAEIFDPATNQFAATGSLQTARADQTATLLPSGQVLVAGGDDNAAGTPNAIGTSEVYDVVSGGWSQTTALNQARYGHLASQLPNGQVLIAGGENLGTALRSTELYDPATNGWSMPTGARLNVGRFRAMAAQLPGGVVAAGGASAEPASANGLASAEIYSVDAGTWTALNGGLATARSSGTASVLPDGRLVFAGGVSSAGSSNAVDVYDPELALWLPTTVSNDLHDHHGAAVLPNGQLLIAGGPSASGNLELFDEGQGALPAAVPSLSGAAARQVPVGSSLAVQGANLTGLGEASSGNTQSSPTNYPLYQIENLDSQWHGFAGSIDWTKTSGTAVIPATLLPGWYLLRPIVNGVAGTGLFVQVGTAPQPDAGPIADAGPADAGFADAGFADAGVADAGVADAGEPTDAGISADAGDAGPQDAGSIADAGPTDAGGAADGGLDAGSGVPDAGMDGGPVPNADAGPTGADAGAAPTAFGCGCASTGGSPLSSLPWLLLLLLVSGRRRRTAVGLAAIAALALAPAARAAPPPGRSRVAVVGIKVYLGLDPKLADILDEQLVGTMAQDRPGLQILSSKDVAAMVSFAQERQIMGCAGDTQCLTEIGGALGVDRSITGSISRVGKSIVVNFTLFNEKKGLVEKRFSRRIREASEEALLDVIGPAVETLLGNLGKIAPPPPVVAEPAPAKPPTSTPPPPSAAAEVTPGPETAAAPVPNLPILVAVRFQGAPNFSTLQGAIVPQVGYRLGNAFAFSAGVLIAQPIGFMVRAAWVPFNQEGLVRPVVALELPVVLTSPVAIGPGASVGVDFAPLPWLGLGLEIPALYFVGAPKGLQQAWIFGATTLSVRL